MANFCSNCGERLEPDAEFCSSCGFQIIPLTDNQVEQLKGTIEIRNFVGENDNIIVLDEKGPFKVIEYEKDLSVAPSEAVEKYYSSKMKVRPRQLVVDLNKTSGIYLQAGAMQWMSGANKLSADVKGFGDFGKKFLKSATTGETIAKPEYAGDGFVVSEQTYKHLIILDMNDWENFLTIDDGLFLAAENTIELSFERHREFSNVLAAANIFYTALHGEGYVCLESDIPMEELIVIELTNQIVTIDGPLAIAWTGTLEFSGEKSGKTIVDSAVTREGLVNVFRGTGKILMAPLSTRFKGKPKMPKPDNLI